MTIDADLSTVSARTLWVYEQEHARTKVTRVAFAKAIGVTKQAVAQWFQGATRAPKPEHLFRIEDVYGWSARWIATGRGDRRVKVASATAVPAREPLVLYSLHPDEQSRLLAMFDQLSPAQRAKVMEELEATVRSNAEIARHLGRLPHHPDDSYVGNHIKPAPAAENPQKARFKADD